MIIGMIQNRLNSTRSIASFLAANNNTVIPPISLAKSWPSYLFILEKTRESIHLIGRIAACAERICVCILDLRYRKTSRVRLSLKLKRSKQG